MGKDRNASKPNQAAFNFGVAEQLDNRQASQDTVNNYGYILPGLKHIFTLWNQGTKPIKITALQSQDESLSKAAILDKEGDPVDLPYTLAPNRKVEVTVALNYYAVPSGPASAIVRVIGSNPKQTLAQLQVSATVKPGVEFQEKAVEFGVTSDPSAYQTVTLVFDRKVPLEMLPLPLKCICGNPNLTTNFMVPTAVPKGVKIDADKLTFTSLGEPLSQDIRVDVRIGFRPDVPLGSIDTKVELIMVGAPLAAIVETAKIPVRGTLQGHLSAGPKTVLKITDALGEDSVIITCAAPINAEDLKVESSNASVLVELGSDPAPTEGKSTAKLRVHLKPDLPPGQYSSTIAVRNAVNQEWLAIPVTAIVPKQPPVMKTSP